MRRRDRTLTVRPTIQGHLDRDSCDALGGEATPVSGVVCDDHVAVDEIATPISRHLRRHGQYQKVHGVHWVTAWAGVSSDAHALGLQRPLAVPLKRGGTTDQSGAQRFNISLLAFDESGPVARVGLAFGGLTTLGLLGSGTSSGDLLPKSWDNPAGIPRSVLGRQPDRGAGSDGGDDPLRVGGPPVDVGTGGGVRYQPGDGQGMIDPQVRPRRRPHVAPAR